MSTRKRNLLLSGVIATILCAGILIIIIGIFPTKAEVSFQTQPESEVYVDGKLLGKSPQTIETRSSRIVIKLIPSKESGYLPYETALSLTPYTRTIVRHNFGNAANETTQILQFIKTHENEAPMTITTNPDNSYIFIDNQYVGTSPLRITRPQSIYSVQVMHTGFQAMQVSLKNANNYDLTAFLSLAVQPVTASKSTNSGNQNAIVTVKKTPTGYLRVHTSPSEQSADIARTEVGREYNFLQYSPLKDWIQINLNASQSGWIRSEYATVSGYIATPP